MKLSNYEFKAAVEDIDRLELKLLTINPVYVGEDHQVDTYFVVSHGRLKLREGNIENSLIYYERDDFPSSKSSEVIIYNHPVQTSLKEILLKTMKVHVSVCKKRKIYYVGNVKIHFDVLENLGRFIEVEAINKDRTKSIEELKGQCDFYFSFFNLKESDYISKSYCDLMADKILG